MNDELNEIVPLRNRFVRNYRGRADLFCAKCFGKGTASYRKWSESEAARVLKVFQEQGWMITATSAICPACARGKPKVKRVVYRTVRWGRVEKSVKGK